LFWQAGVIDVRNKKKGGDKALDLLESWGILGMGRFWNDFSNFICIELTY
jgi:hypothetical protein